MIWWIHGIALFWLGCARLFYEIVKDELIDF